MVSQDNHLSLLSDRTTEWGPQGKIFYCLRCSIISFNHFFYLTGFYAFFTTMSSFVRLANAKKKNPVFYHSILCSLLSDQISIPIKFVDMFYFILHVCVGIFLLSLLFGLFVCLVDWFFNTESHHVALACVGLNIFLPQSSKCWNYRHTPSPCLARFCFIAWNHKTEFKTRLLGHKFLLN